MMFSSHWWRWKKKFVNLMPYLIFNKEACDLLYGYVLVFVDISWSSSALSLRWISIHEIYQIDTLIVKCLIRAIVSINTAYGVRNAYRSHRITRRLFHERSNCLHSFTRNKKIIETVNLRRVHTVWMYMKIKNETPRFFLLFVHGITLTNMAKLMNKVWQ